MMTLSSALKRMAGGYLEHTLKQVTSSRMQGFLLGTGITVLLQSSSALTVMLVGLVDSGIMELRQTIGVIMGSNVGTTLTTWLFALSDPENGSIAHTLFDPQNLSSLLALAGVLLAAVSRRSQQQNTGHLLVGFSILLCGMELMTKAAAPLADSFLLDRWIALLRNPILGFLSGTVLTAVIQSSAASIGILQALTLAQPVSYAMAIPIIMGQNLGTCATALLSSVSTSRRARQVAVLHVSFNLIGTLFGFLFLAGTDQFLHVSFLNLPASPAGIALCHTLFNIGTTLLLLPFPTQLEGLVLHLAPLSPRGSLRHSSHSAPRA